MARGSRTVSQPDQLLLITPPSDWSPPTRLPDIPTGSELGVDTETRDDGLASESGPGWVMGLGHIVGFSVAWRGPGGRGVAYVPLRHPDTQNWDVGEAMRWLQDAMDRARRVVFHNRQYDEGWLSTERVTVREDADDTQAAAVLLDENWDAYNLDVCCRRAGVAGKNETALREAAAAYGMDPKKDLWRLPARYVGPYAEDDARATLELWDVLWPQLVEQGLEEAYRLEIDLVPMALAMRRRGIRIDESAAERVQRDLRQRRQRVLDDLKDRLGVRRAPTMEELTSGKQLSPIFDSQGLSYPKTPTTKVGSFKKEWLEAQDHWLPQLVLQARALDNMADKFIGQYILPSLHVGRVHAEIHMLRDEEGGTRSYRLSYSNPPLQQMPARDPELAPLIRGIFLPERDTLWGAADYSQQEPRLAVHLASICRIAGAADAVEYYLRDPSADFHQMVSDLTGLSRSQAKIINLGLMYGMGLAKLARSLRVTIEEAQAIIEQYHARMPWVKGLTEFCEARAKVRGHIRLLDGARCRFDHWEPWGNGRDTKYAAPMRHAEALAALEDPHHAWYRAGRLRRADTRKAMNRAVQGGAARQTKMAMRDCWREGIVPLLSMHDELDFSIENPRIGARVEEIMKEAVQLRVPMKVDLQYGRTWGEAATEYEAKVDGKKVKLEPPTWDEIMAAGRSENGWDLIRKREAA